MTTWQPSDWKIGYPSTCLFVGTVHIYVPTCQPIRLLCLSVYLLTRLSIFQAIYLTTCPPIQLSTCALVYLSDCVLVYLSICLPTELFICILPTYKIICLLKMSFCAPAHLFVCLPDYLFFCLFICLYLYLSIWLPVYSITVYIMSLCLSASTFISPPVYTNSLFTNLHVYMSVCLHINPFDYPFVPGYIGLLERLQDKLTN